ncbi:MAG: response regulator [Myxococcales bacterium]|nr:response regulator [Myxococcales bacterium]
MEPSVDILLVDDTPSNLLALEAILGGPEQPSRFVRATSGMHALRHLLEQDFALIILDIQMPGMDGFETAALIRGRERSRRIPIIFLTAFSRSDSAVQRGYALGAVDFLFKPIVPEILRAKVAVFVDLHRKTEEIRKQAAELHERQLQEERQRWETDLLRQQYEQERRTSNALSATVRERERNNARLKFLADTANQLLFNPEPRHVLPDIFRRLAEHLRLEVHACYLIEGDDTHLALEAHAGFGQAFVDANRRLAFGQGVSGAVAARREQCVVRDGVIQPRPGAADPGPFSADLPELDQTGIRALCCYPLMAAGRLIGTLLFATRTREQLLGDEIDALHIVGDQTAMALERARLLDELQRRADALAEGDRRKDEFLAMLAHELRNPLVPILTGLKTIQLADLQSPKLVRARDAIERQVRHMVRLVDDLLDVSRVTAGKIDLRRDVVDIAAVVRQAVQTSQPHLQERQHSLEVLLPDDLPGLLADPARLAQILANLLNNAAKYTDPGGRIVLAAADRGDAVELRVSDNGRGIRADMLPRVFDLFVQSDRTLELAQGGLGVGLTLIKRLVELHGGSVSAHSEGERRGSEFVVRLPGVVRREPPAPTAAPAPAPARALRILVVDDQPDIRDTVRDLLEMLGHRVSIAVDGDEAVARLLTERPDVALVDIGLPGRDGYEVARTVRRTPDLPTRLIAMTGFGLPEDRVRAFDAGFQAHLIKPVDLDELARLLADFSP